MNKLPDGYMITNDPQGYFFDHKNGQDTGAFWPTEQLAIEDACRHNDAWGIAELPTGYELTKDSGGWYAVSPEG